MKTILAIGFATLAPVVAASAATTITSSFSGPGVPAGLQEQIPSTWTFNGTASLNPSADATNTAVNNRAHVRTIATDYNTVDFIYELTYIVPTNPNDYDITFIGLGQGVNDSIFGEPGTGIYLRTQPNGEVWVRIESDNSASVQEQPSIGDIGDSSAGTHRVRITKSASTLLFEHDSNYTGTFVSDFSASRNLADVSDPSPNFSFLNSTNSRLFFTSGFSDVNDTTVTQFDDLIISVPEPAAISMLLMGVCGLVSRRRA